MSGMATARRAYGKTAVRAALLAGVWWPGRHNGATAYVANFGSNTVTPINTATNTAGRPITVGRGPVAMVIKP